MVMMVVLPWFGVPSDMGSAIIIYAGSIYYVHIYTYDIYILDYISVISITLILYNPFMFDVHASWQSLSKKLPTKNTRLPRIFLRAM